MYYIYININIHTHQKPWFSKLGVLFSVTSVGCNKWKLSWNESSWAPHARIEQLSWNDFNSAAENERLEVQPGFTNEVRVPWICHDLSQKMEVSINGGNPKSSILVNFWGSPIYGNPQMGFTLPHISWPNCPRHHFSPGHNFVASTEALVKEPEEALVGDALHGGVGALPWRPGAEVWTHPPKVWIEMLKCPVSIHPQFWFLGFTKDSWIHTKVSWNRGTPSYHPFK